MPCNFACSVIPTADVLETDQWTIGNGETTLDSELQGGILWDAVQDKRQKGKPCHRKKEGTEQGRQMKHRQFTHKVMSERIGMDLIQSIKVSSDNFRGWGKKRRLKTKII
jgi:hypothetical protein